MEDYFSKDTFVFIHDLKKVLIDRGLHLATAESCTGGLLATVFTELPGSSEFYQGGVSCYSNQVKQSILGVSEDNLQKYGAVSKEVAKELVVSVKDLLKVDCGISITGIAGPTGGTKEKPVGTVWCGFFICGDIKVKRYYFEGDRSAIRFQVLENVIRDFHKALVS